MEQNIVNYTLFASCFPRFLIKRYPVGFSCKQHSVGYGAVLTITHWVHHWGLRKMLNVCPSPHIHQIHHDQYQSIWKKHHMHISGLITQFLFKHIPLLLKFQSLMCRCLDLADKEHPLSLHWLGCSQKWNRDLKVSASVEKDSRGSLLSMSYKQGHCRMRWIQTLSEIKKHPPVRYEWNLHWPTMDQSAAKRSFQHLSSNHLLRGINKDFWAMKSFAQHATQTLLK